MPTVGVSIAVPEPWATQLQDYRTSIGDLTAALIPTHVTLVPPQEVEDFDEVAAHLERASAGVASFRIHLRGTGTFRPVSPVVFVTVAEGISACEALAQRLRSGPLDVPLKFPYHPHVTIAHHLDDVALDRAYAELADFECLFDVSQFHLYLHDDEAGWQPTRAFPLGRGV
ncbi:MAG: 2'-5' RNA ligase family protein [Nocardioides sp.]|jgi:2'-5' RNA ligase